MDDDVRAIIITILVIVVLVLAIIIPSCYVKHVHGNKQFFDFNQSFNTAYVEFPDGTSQTIKIQAWNDYDNSDSIQIIDMNGKPYYTHLNRVILTKE